VLLVEWKLPPLCFLVFVCVLGSFAFLGSVSHPPPPLCIPSLAFIVRECHAFSLVMKAFRTVIAGEMMAGASVSLVW